MSYPDYTTSGHTRSGKMPNPGRGTGGSLPSGTDSSRTRRGKDPNPGNGRNGSAPPAANTTGYTTGSTGSRPSPVHVQSGPKITRLNKS